VDQNALGPCMDMSDYIVIGCIGLEGVGKSTLLSMLAALGPYRTEEKLSPSWFPIQSFGLHLV